MAKINGENIGVELFEVVRFGVRKWAKLESATRQEMRAVNTDDTGRLSDVMN